jgi:Electron transfer DM13
MKRSSNSARCAAQTVVLCLAAGLVACGGGGSDVPAAPAVAQGAEGTAACGRSDNVKVGQVANLSTLALDNCTIEITSFNYDGQGLPDVFVYGALAGNYAAGFAVGANLFGTPRANTTVRVTLKAGELNQLDGISIWCVRAGVSFGDGRFAKVT